MSLRWGPGYSQVQLDDAQARWSLRFPPDLVDLYRERRPILPAPGAIDWMATPEHVIQERLDWPLHGFWFDVQHGGLWWREWGRRPDRLEDQYEALRTAFEKAPRMIPIYSHRYIPAEPHELGNPVFSIYQSDVIHYGADLIDYFEREAKGYTSKPWPGSIKQIRFWTLAVERNNGASGTESRH